MRPHRLRVALTVLLFLCAVAVAGDVQAGAVVILVKHAEKAVATDADPPLSPAGKARAHALARALAEARIDLIITSQYRRTRETAAPLAGERGLTPVVIGAGSDIDAHIRDVAAAVKARPPAKAILVVGHSNTSPAIIEALGGPRLPDFSEAEHATLFTLVLSDVGPPLLVRSSYGVPDPTGDKTAE